MKYKCHGVTTIRIILLSLNPRTVVTSDQFSLSLFFFTSLWPKQWPWPYNLTYSHHYLHISLQITGPVLLINYCSITGQAFCGHTRVPRPRVAEYWTCFLVNTHKHMFFRGGTMSGQNVNLIDTKEYYEINIFNDHLFLPIPLSSTLYVLCRFLEMGNIFGQNCNIVILH